MSVAYYQKRMSTMVVLVLCGLLHGESAQSAPQEEVEGRMNDPVLVVKLPLEDTRLGWKFIDEQVIQSSEVTLFLNRNASTVTNRIILGGELCPGWSLDVRVLSGVDGAATVFVGHSNQQMLKGDRFILQVSTQTNLWGCSSMIQSYLPSGTYRTNLEIGKREIDAAQSNGWTVDLVNWDAYWPTVITKFYSQPADEPIGFFVRAVLRAKHEYEYLILSDVERMQTRLYRRSPAFVEMWRPQEIDSLVGLKRYIERCYEITFPEGTGVFAGPVPLTYLVRNKQGALNKIRGVSNEKREVLFGLYGAFEEGIDRNAESGGNHEK